MVASSALTWTFIQRVLFQSPSLRGSGRFSRRREAVREARRRVSIPFIAGQWSLPKKESEARRDAERFQSPSLRGSGRFTRPPLTPAWPGRAFQSPSLRGSGRFERPARRTAGGQQGFNPLHCGAVVASRGPRSGRRRKWSFNPLHCGAVVASGRARRTTWSRSC